jgi:hypothetical protein
LRAKIFKLLPLLKASNCRRLVPLVLTRTIPKEAQGALLRLAGHRGRGGTAELGANIRPAGPLPCNNY